MRKLYAGWAAALLLSTALPAAGGETWEESVELAFLNGDYEDLDSDIAPIHQGPLVIRITSPEHRMTVHGNQLALRPGPGGVAAAEIAVELEGYGRLVAELQSLGSSRFEDRVDVPRQTLSVAGKIRIERAEEGFLLTVVELPATARLRIQSGVAEQLVGLCEGFDKLPLLSLDCPGLEASLGVAAVPLPGPGETFLLADHRLEPEDRAFFERVSRRLAAAAVEGEEYRPSPER